MKRKLDLNPAAGAAAGAQFDLRRGKVRRWVAELPSANLAELARRLHEALTQVSAQQNSTRQLLHFLEAVAPAAALVFPHLERQYAGQPLPLNDAGTRASNMAVEIRAGLLMGYRNVLRTIVPEKEEAARWRVLWYRRELVTVLHRFIHYGDGLLEIYRMLHIDPPEGLWRRIHRCYRLADKHKLAAKQVRLFDEKPHKSSIEHAYKRLVLSSLLPTGAVAPGPQKEIDATLDHWVRMVQLRPAAQFQAGILYLTRLARDFGPLAVAEVAKETLESENTCLIDTRALCVEIDRWQTRGGRRRWWRREHSLTPEMLTVLHDNWCTVHHRTEMRVAIDLPAEVAVGLSALFYLTGGRASAPTQAQRPSGPIVALEEKVQGGQWLGKTQGADVWDTAPDRVRSAAPMQTAAPIQHGEHEYSAIPGRLVDRSDHGMAVVIARTELRQAAVGMPVAVRTRGSDWIIGSIMRLKDRGDAVELGLKRILNGAAPARLRVREGARVSPPFDVVLGKTHDGRRAAAVPAVSALRSGDPEIELGGKNLPVGRGALLLQSRYMDAFVLEISSGEAMAAIDQAAQAAAVASSRKIPAAENSGTYGQTPPEEKGGSHEERVRRLMEKTGLARTDAEFIVEAEMASNPEGGH